MGALLSPELAVIVPGRLASQRFPRKLLHPIGGVPLILRTAAAVRAAAPGWPLFFAVAEEELADVLRAAGYEALMTDPAHPSGTDRLAEANRTVGARWVVNIQADEPLVRPAHLRLLAEAVRAPGTAMATLASPFEHEADFRNPAKVKVVCAAGGRALYFSRAPIPWDRDAGGWRPGPALWHMGAYAYTAEFLDAFTRLPPGRLEQIEKLEQLRALEHGHPIAVAVTNERSLGVDTPEDAARLAAHLLAEGSPVP